MSSGNHVNVAYRHFLCRRKGLVTALTTGIDDILQKCSTVSPGAQYKDKYVLVGLTSGDYRIDHPAFFFDGLEPPCLPLYCGHITENIWLTLAIETSNAWLHSTVLSDAANLSAEEKKHLIERIGHLPKLKNVVLALHKKIQRDEPVAPAVLNTVQELSPCENKSCLFVTSNRWIECIICSRWYHCVCVAVSPLDRHSRHTFICQSC